jgi:hypothetical protein
MSGSEMSHKGPCVKALLSSLVLLGSGRTIKRFGPVGGLLVIGGVSLMETLGL